MLLCCVHHAVNPCIKTKTESPLVVQWVKDLVLSVQQLWSLLGSGFDPWPGNFHIPWVMKEKKKKKERQRERDTADMPLLPDCDRARGASRSLAERQEG